MPPMGDTNDTGERLPTLVRALCAALQARTREPVELVETHISWVLLAGDAAYKIKKPVRLPFVDYGTVESRRRFCEEEVRLNRRLAGALYLGVSRITGRPEAPELDGRGPALEHAVRMRRFAHGALFSERLAAGTLGHDEIDRLAALLARFHETAPPARADSGFGSAEARRACALAAIDGLEPFGFGTRRTALRAWLDAQSIFLAPLWAARQTGGRVRECHGDLHLANLLWLDGEVAAFDCIEFDPALRWIDVLDDVAFAVMDLVAHDRHDLAFRLLNAWLDRTGDHAGLPALRFSMVYRAVVRTLVAAMRQQQGIDTGLPARVYFDAAAALASNSDARLLITHGLPGSGKTFVSQRLLEQAGAIRLRSDVERKRLFGLGALDDSRAAGARIYDSSATERTYEHLLAMARTALQSGYPTIIDAAFLRRAERARAAALAHGLKRPFAILDCQAELSVLRERVKARRDHGGDASEADEAVLERLLAAREPLDDGERACSIEVDSGRPIDAAAIADAWRSRRLMQRKRAP